MNNSLMNRYETALKKIGGALALLNLPEQIKTVLMNCNDLETKVKMLELIAEQMKKEL